MTKTKLFTAAAILSSLIASPALAQDVSRRSVAVGQEHYNANTYDRRDSGFWPGEVATGIVGGAIGTAGALATAPFRGEAYASNDGYDGRYNDSYAARNGFVCQPGTWFRGEDGLMHICQ